MFKVAVGKSLKMNPGAFLMRCLWAFQSTMRWKEIDLPSKASAMWVLPVPEGP